jgi:hypothetical protein
MRTTGIGRSSTMLGMTSGITPNAAYLASIKSTRAAGGIAGKGMPVSSMMSIKADMSLPLTTSFATPPSPGCVSTCVVTPSITDSARPPIVTTSTTRIIGRAAPPLTRNSVRSGERAGRSNVSSKPA